MLSFKYTLVKIKKKKVYFSFFFTLLSLVEYSVLENPLESSQFSISFTLGFGKHKKKKKRGTNGISKLYLNLIKQKGWGYNINFRNVEKEQCQIFKSDQET